jgi:4-diphosphocytidyl-2-C-methyl-D-erythritol kinase
MILYPPCKINLGLHILHKRNDGFHELDTCMYEIPLYDILEIIPSEEFVFTSSGLEIPGDSDNNLCVKAFKLIKEKHEISNVKIHLHKQIPMGGGLGGGSSDATYVLKMLNTLFNLNLELETLEEYAAILGSDCAFFVKSNCQIAKGRGELLSHFNLNLKGYYLKILNIGIHVSTAEAYGGVIFQTHIDNVVEILKLKKEDWKDKLVNDFETSVFKKHPILSEIKNSLYQEGAFYASMSGSGSTMFALYENKPKENSFLELNPLYEIVKEL